MSVCIDSHDDKGVGRERFPLWKLRGKLSKREGLRAPIYEVNLDCYTGEWTNDRKHGMKEKCHWHIDL